MANNYARHLNPVNTPQNEPLPGRVDMVANNAGGFGFAVDDWTRLDRFLVLGGEGGTYYVNERKLTIDNAKAVQRCLDADPIRTVNRIVEISDSGRAPKNDAAVFALALATMNKSAASLVADAMPKVCRIGTHLFQFVDAVNSLRGWGRGLRKTVANWYDNQDMDSLAYQLVKYQNREKWTHKDVLRLCHYGANSPLMRWVIGAGNDARSIKRGKAEDAPTSKYAGVSANELPGIVQAFEEAKQATDAKDICKLIRNHNLPRECIPTQFLNEVSVWEALLEKMPMTAMIRNLATMTRCGLIAPLSAATKTISERLGDVARLKKGRIHPLAILVALKTYTQGRGMRSENTWTPVQSVADALNEAFYLAFQAIEPTGKRWMFGVDVSGSMGVQICGSPLTAAEGSTALALVSAATEKQTYISAFCNTFKELPITPKMRLDEACCITRGLTFGGTDCSLPILEATRRRLEVDVFVTITDSETWAGHIHPNIALQQYRQKTGIPAKNIVVGMTATEFSIADPTDAGMLDVCGMDTGVPQLMADFVRN